MIRASLPVAVFVLFSSLASWTQITQTNEPVRDPLSARPADGVAGQMDEIQPVAPSGTRPQSRKGPLVIREVKHDTGPLLREIAPLLPEFSTPSEHEIENNVNPNHHWSNRVQKDTMLQTEENSPALQTPNFGLEFDGAGFGDSFFCYCMPPDNDGAAGTTQYVQYINVEYQVFDKSGNTVLGPLSGNAFWSGFGGSCQADNSGDPVLRFDAAAQRWVVAQFAINNSGPDYECVAVSTTADATGSYNRYAFPFNDFPDYPKMGVWPDAYYFTFNNFDITGSYFVGANVCAADRTRMLAGAAATIQCFQQNSNQFGMLPSDLDGATPPAAGTPNFVMELDPDGSANLDMFKFHVDFTTPANSTFTGPTLIPVSAFTPLCNSNYRGGCVPQPTTNSDLLESLSDRLMWRLVYRNFGDHTTLLVSHSIVAGSSGGVRWYEIHNPETSPTVFQSGTFAPDSQYRWMPAIAMDANQDIAVGFSRSGVAAGQFPSLVYAGRVPSDPAGTLESEVVLKAGAGSQSSGYGRWGDYSSVTVDPTDDCTFWFTEEYEKATGGFNWSTAIGSFKFPGCGATPNFSLSAAPNTLTIGQGSSGTSTITVTPSNGFTGSVNLSASGLPSGVTAGFSPNPATSTSTLTLTASATAAAGPVTVTITATGTGGSPTQTVPLALTVAIPSFTLTPSASSAIVATGGSTPITVTTAAVNGFKSAVALSVSGLPKGVIAIFLPTSISSPGSGGSTLTLAAAANTTAGSYSLTITGTGGGVTKTAPISLTVVVPSFTLTPSAASATVATGAPVQITLTTAAVNGFNSAVTLSVSDLPKGVTAALSHTSIAAPGNGASTLTLTEITGAAASIYNLTITGTGGGVTKTATLRLTVVLPSFTLMLSGTSVTMKHGGTIPVTVTTTVVSGFNSAVAFSLTGLPKGVTAGFSPTSIAAPGNGSSTLTLKAASGTASGTFTLTVTGAGKALTETQKLTLTITH
jgi:hypothetical protein